MQLLEGYAPDPTGTIHVWNLTDGQMQRAIELLQEIRQAQYWNDEALVSSLVETLQSLPGFPKGEPGDHWVIKRRKGA